MPVAAIGGDENEKGEMKLYTYYRSQASFRVRIALNLKGKAREDSFLHLEKGASSPLHTGQSIRRWWSQP